MCLIAKFLIQNYTTHTPEELWVKIIDPFTRTLFQVSICIIFFFFSFRFSNTLLLHIKVCNVVIHSELVGLIHISLLKAF